MTDGLAVVLLRAQALGFLGPGDPDHHRRHALAIAVAVEALEGKPPSACCDLGAGGGVPGLVLAARWPATAVGLLEASGRRCRFLREAIEALGLEHASVIEGRAEELARQPACEGRFPIVTSRSFGPPSATAECAARLLSPGGVLVVSEPPSPDPTGSRWPEGGLATLGLAPAIAIASGPSVVAIRRAAQCPERYPRRTGVPTKRPLF